jgi:general secretion pathway protein B
MSLILEALKKSEARRRLGEAPDLGTPFTPASRRRSSLPLILLAIVVVAGFGSWYVYSSRIAPTPALQPKGTANASARTPAIITPSRAPAGPASAPAANPGNSAIPATSPLSTRLLSPHRVLPAQPAAIQPGAIVQGAAPASKPVAVEKSVQPMRAAPIMPTRSPATTSVPAPTPTPLPEPGQPHPDTPAVSATSDAANDKTQQSTPTSQTAPAAPTLPLYYELPLNVRKDLPQIALNMHVYAADPKQRFVVVDGERKAEGDTIKDNLFLREIRADGLVLEFRGQRFFFPRTGR